MCESYIYSVLLFATKHDRFDASIEFVDRSRVRDCLTKQYSLQVGFLACILNLFFPERTHCLSSLVKRDSNFLWKLTQALQTWYVNTTPSQQLY